MKKLLSKAASSLLVFSMVLAVSGFSFNNAQAAALTAISDTMSTVKVSTASSHVIKFTTPTGATSASQTIVVTFPSDFNFTSKAIASLTFTHGASTGAESTETLAASPSASAWGAVFSGTQNRILTLTTPTDGTGAAALSAGDKVILTYSSANSTNGSTATSYSITLNCNGDTGTITVNLLTDDGVAVSATVPNTLTFSLGSNSVALGTLSTGAASTGTNTMTLGTNGTSGATITVSGTTLTSGANTITACASGCTSTAGSEQFGINLVSNSSPSVGAAVSGSAPIGSAATNYATANTFRFVTGETVATASNAINTSTFTVSYLANIAALTEAGSYTTTLTYVATANF